MTLTSELLGAETKKLLERPDLAALIPSHLVLLHQMSRASVPLMKVARREAKRVHNDRVCARLVEYFGRHMEEERYHDEWVLEDLASIGIHRDEIMLIAPSARVASMVGAQYYWVLHHHPVALLGYIAMLESNAPSVALIEDLQSQTGLPASAFRTMRLHAEVDKDHQSALAALFDELPLDDPQESMIAVSAAYTGASFAYCLADLRPWKESATRVASA